MKILLIGYGKMGGLICKTLKDNKMVTELTVCDTKFTEAFTEDGINFLPSSENLCIPSFHSIFVATPAETHYSNIVDLINRGAKNIYVEKPSVTTLSEYEHVKSIAGDCKIAVGYILRQSESAIALREYLNQIEAEGFVPEVCTVAYQKYMPFESDERAKTDLGVDEELVHVYDMIFNYFGFEKGKIIKKCSRTEPDPLRPDRIIYARYGYVMQFGGHHSLVHIKSSFRSKEQCREFFFSFTNHQGCKRYIHLSFDTAKYIDKLTVKSEKGETILHYENPSLNKLSHQLDEVIHYFETGESKNLALLSETLNVIKRTL